MWILRLAHSLEESANPEVEIVNHAPRYWRDWLTELFPELFYHEFAQHQVDFWEWVEAITAISKPCPFIAIWPRGGSKTTSAEAAVVRLAAKGTRKFCLYVRSTQDMANESINNIAAMLESKSIEDYYPLLSERQLSKYGFSKGWRGDMLRCASGFSVVGLGFDAAVRGVKIEEARPDIIVLDDVDAPHDTLATVNKKIKTLTSSILPAGATNVAILGVQNLIHENSIFTQLAEGSADFLHDRQISGPHPAVTNLEYEQRPQGGYTITAGQATWAGQSLAICESQINEWGLHTFLSEAQHEVEQRGGIWDAIKFWHCDSKDVPDIVRGCVWIDPAVTSTDESDAQGIQADGLGEDGLLYRFFSWEQIASPEEVLKRGILKALELGFTTVGVETDQGGDVWKSAYDLVWNKLEAASTPILSILQRRYDNVQDLSRFKPIFKQAKAGSGHGSKVERNQRMLFHYEQGKVIHVRGTHQVLEKALRRFPNKPLDLADAAYWACYDLLESPGGGKVGSVNRRQQHQQQEQADNVLLRYLGTKTFMLPGVNWVVMEGWTKRLPRQLGEQIAGQFPQYFEVK